MPRVRLDASGDVDDESAVFLPVSKPSLVPFDIAEPDDDDDGEDMTAHRRIDLVMPVELNRPRSQKEALVYTVLRNSFFMLAWFVLSTGLSMYNKWLMGKDYYNFPYPLFMTSIHFLVQFLLSELLLRLMCHQLRKDAKVLTWANYFKMVVPTGAAGALDIGFSNYSLMFITLSFYTMCKSTAPIFLLGFSFLFGIEQISAKIVGLIAFITLGLLLTVYGETHFDIRGFVLVMIAAVLAGVRWSLTQILLQKEELGLRHPLSTMNKTMPVMFVCLIVVAIPMERLWELTSSPHFSSFGAAMATISLMLCGALMAFGMILSEFQFIHSTSAITFVVAGISKELVTIVCAVLFFGDVFGPVNIAGLFIVVMGIVLFNFYKLYYLQRKVESGRGRTLAR